MRVYNRYLLILCISASLVNVLLAAVGQSSLDVYVIINIVTYLAVTLLFIYFNPRARKALSGVGIALFGIFLVLLTLNVAKIIQG